MVDMLQIIENVVDIIGFGTGGGFMFFITVFCWLLAVWFLWQSLMLAAKRAELGANFMSWWGPVVTLVVAVCFAGMPGFIELLSVSVFGEINTSPEAIFSTAPETAGLLAEGSRARLIAIGLVTIGMMIGFIGFIRGLIMFQRSATNKHNAPDPWAAFIHCVAGILAMNFPLTLGMLESLIT